MESLAEESNESNAGTSFIPLSFIVVDATMVEKCNIDGTSLYL